MTEFEKMKAWLGNGEFDIDAMIRMGATNEPQVRELCRTLKDSPWYVQHAEHERDERQHLE